MFEGGDLKGRITFPMGSDLIRKINQLRTDNAAKDETIKRLREALHRRCVMVHHHGGTIMLQEKCRDCEYLKVCDGDSLAAGKE